MAFDLENALYDQQGNYVDPYSFISSQYRDQNYWDDLAGYWNSLSYDPRNVDIMKRLLSQGADPNARQMGAEEHNAINQQMAGEWKIPGTADSSQLGPVYNTGSDLAAAFGWSTGQQAKQGSASNTVQNNREILGSRQPAPPSQPRPVGTQPPAPKINQQQAPQQLMPTPQINKPSLQSTFSPAPVKPQVQGYLNSYSK